MGKEVKKKHKPHCDMVTGRVRCTCHHVRASAGALMSTQEFKDRCKAKGIHCPGDVEAALGMTHTLAHYTWSGERLPTERTIAMLKEAEEGLPVRACTWLERRLLATADPRVSAPVYLPAPINSYDKRDWAGITARLEEDGLLRRNSRNRSLITAKGLKTIEFYRKKGAKL